jgi:1,2-diacylglycerol 3-beta-galactosyltransferase
MPQSPPDPAKILFLFSDTGGGHRSAAEAIIEALKIEYEDRIRTTMVDVFREYAPPPLQHVPELYPRMVRAPRAWGLGFHLSDGQRRAKLIDASTWPYVRRNVRALIVQHPSDLIVSVHPLAIAPALRALRSLGKLQVPLVTVVTDLVTGHALWYHRKAALTLVPTRAAFQRAVDCRLDPKRVKVVGLPVADRFCQPVGDKNALRAQLEWPTEQPVILLVGGGEGMGPLEENAHAIDEARLPAILVVIAGRNKDLEARLEAHNWYRPTLIYGFVHEMPDFMRAADIIVTKAGPGTISEALNAGLPMVLYSRLPGQEEGNVTYVTANGAGVWAPQPDLIVTALRDWIEHPEHRQKAAAAARQLARPDAAQQIAHILAAKLGVE